MEMEPKVGLTYEERQALPVILRLLKRNPEAATLLVKGMTRTGAVAILVQLTSELNALQLVARAFSEAAGAIVQIDKEKENV